MTREIMKLLEFLKIDWKSTLENENNYFEVMWEKFKEIVLRGTHTFVPKVKNFPRHLS